MENTKINKDRSVSPVGNHLRIREDEKLNGFNLGEALFQLFSLGLLVLVPVLIMSFFRSNKNRNNQLDRIEKKINDLDAHIKK